MSVDDVVVVHSSEQPRAFWKLGRVQETLVGRDGGIRGAVLKTTGRSGKALLLQRPIQLLYPLEVHQTEYQVETPQQAMEGEISQENEQDRNDSESIPTRRPKRAAAVQARDQLLAQTLADD